MTKTRQLILIAVMSAIVCALGPLSIPIGAVPITLANLAIFMAASLLGPWKGSLVAIVYLLIGLTGLPVFSSFSGGIGKLLGPTGGYLIGYIPMAFFTGLFAAKWPDNRWLQLCGMVIGTLCLYTFGTLWLSVSAGLDFAAALGAGVLPFIPMDLGKIVFVAVFGVKIRQALERAGLLPGARKTT